MEDDAADARIGTTIDNRFVILGRLGRGGMGTVYRARQTSVDREVALKMLDHVDRDGTAAKRFFREAKLASQLAHPNTVSIIEFGQDGDGHMYLAMELVRGETLSALVRREGALPLDRVVRIGVQMCDALIAATAIGIVHRDLKPDNVIVLDGGHDLIKVLDFGLARSLVDPASPVTEAGMVAGTPRYLAPEVALRGAAPAPAQDVYALGVVLGELSASGRELWAAESLEHLFMMKASGTVALVGVGESLTALIAATMAIDPTARPDASGVRSELLAIAGVRKSAPAAAPAGPPLVPLATEATQLAFTSQIGPSRLVPIDEVAHAQSQAAARRASFGAGLDLPPGGPPPIDASGAEAAPDPAVVAALAAIESPPLEMDAAWAAEKAAKQAAEVPSPFPPRKSRVPSVVSVIVALAVIGGGSAAVVALSHHRTPAVSPASDPPRPTVDIHVVAPAPTDVRIDGARAGKTPFTVSYKRGTQTLAITATIDGTPVFRQVEPDRDQTVDLDPSTTPR